MQTQETNATGPSLPARLQAERLITRRQLRELLAVSDMTISRMIDDGRLPAPLSLGHQHRWREREIFDWLNQCPRGRKP